MVKFFGISQQRLRNEVQTHKLQVIEQEHSGITDLRQGKAYPIQIRSPDPELVASNDFQNVTEASLSEDTFVITFLGRSCQFFSRNISKVVEKCPISEC